MGTQGGGAVLQGSKWDQKVITWNLASSASGSMNPAEQGLVAAAFAQWAAASGLQFEEVSNSAASDISIGWNDFSSASSGVVGFTSYQTNTNHVIQPGVSIELENPSEDPLTVGAEIAMTSFRPVCRSWVDPIQVPLAGVPHRLEEGHRGQWAVRY